ncbi:MAG: tyrosine-type recombinase/integrase [Eggerthellaceae bacterium]|nr:tyrosine-type recombinase/integrase [Eggerthellaceae bacterium]
MLDLGDCAFEGPCAELYRQFVAFKRAMGYKYGEGVLYDLRKISEDIEGARAGEEGPLPQKLVMDWTERRPGESDANRKKRLTLMRQLGLFIEGLGIECFVLPERFIPAKGPRYEPYVFAEDEIAALMAHFDSLPHDRRFPNRSKVQPMLFRTIYGCGTRIGEALDLKVWEVDVGNGVLSINNAKGGKRRQLPMSPSLASCFADYWDEMRLDGAPPDAPVFPSVTREDFYTSDAIRHSFKCACDKLGIRTEKGRLPRVHDLRHTFACHSLDRFMRDGGDPYAMLPVLAAYMGHSNISDTEYYLHLTESGRRFVLDKTSAAADRIFLIGAPHA